MPIEHMVTINATDRNDPQFVEFVTRIIDAVAKFYRPDEIYITQIDHWFDHKWKAFSGKVLGALGVWKGRLTLPPFKPSRVVSQVYYEVAPSGTAIYTLKSAAPLHIDQWSDANMQRFVDRVSRNGVLVWYSGDTKASDTASVMLYHVTDEEAVGWYASFKKKEGWKLNKVEGISRRELSAMLEMSPSPHGI
jgi:hypothetical protein